VEQDRLVGVQFSHTEVTNGQVRILPDQLEAASGELTISSIGSIPEPIPGIPQKGEVYTYEDQAIGSLMNGPTTVFAAGNVLTGKGNIKDSLDSGTEVGTRLAEAYLGLSDEPAPLTEAARKEAQATAEKIAGASTQREKLPPETVERILSHIRKRQLSIGYRDSFRDWITKVTPPDLQ